MCKFQKRHNKNTQEPKVNESILHQSIGSKKGDIKYPVISKRGKQVLALWISNYRRHQIVDNLFISRGYRFS
jgi:hypothetical protein